MKIRLIEEKRELDVKRFYHGYEITDTCPQCGRNTMYGKHDNYIGYPMIGEPIEIWFYCDECGTEWPAKILVRILVEEVK